MPIFISNLKKTIKGQICLFPGDEEIFYSRKFFIDQGRRPRDGRDDIEEARLTTESYDEGVPATLTRLLANIKVISI